MDGGRAPGRSACVVRQVPAAAAPPPLGCAVARPRRAKGLLALAQVGLLLAFNLNAINGPLPNFWIACLLGAMLESLLSTYNVLGRMRSFLGWLLYVLL
mmetsp:Transcript_3326/g.8241  ORF Transcript_3326/g.8241 Transcript_3326/m.8241 type:complete len:99 (-) Transcript_3326:81-377(-)